jgi:hypothetical protein
MTDRIEYEAPLGFLGRVVDGLFLNRYLTDLITRRNEFIKNGAESS